MFKRKKKSTLPGEFHPRRVNVFRDTKGEYRWNVEANNGRVIADSGEGYINYAHALAMAEGLFPGIELRDMVQPTR